MKFNILSRIGGRKENQDSFGYAETSHGLLIVVCDGMGGARGGKTASELAVKTIIDKVSATELNEADEILTEAIKAANYVVSQMGKTNQELQGMGTTAVALLIDEEKATAAHVGDSRIYQVRGARKVFRTFDHSLVFQLVKRGTITEEQARLSAESNVILRALGSKSDVEVEINSDLAYLKGDRFLLCSDGICGAITEKELVKLVISEKSIEQTTNTLVETIDQLGISNGGKHDNLTAAVLEVNSNSTLKPKMDNKSKLIIGVITLVFLISLSLNVFLFLRGYKGEGIKQVNPTEMTSKLKIDSLQKITQEDSMLNIAHKEVRDLLSKHKSDSLQVVKSNQALKGFIKPLQEIEKESSNKNKGVLRSVIESIQNLK